MSALILRLRTLAQPGPGALRGDFWWTLLAGGAVAVVLAFALALSLQAACAFVLIVGAVALYEHNRQWGIAMVFAIWFIGPGLRRVLGLSTGYLESDPLSLAPFLATATLAALELGRAHAPTRIRQIVLLAAGGFALGLPIGLLTGPRSAVYAFIAYTAAISGAVFGLREGDSLRDSTLRRVLLYGMPPIAVYAMLQHWLPLPEWDRDWINATEFGSIGIEGGSDVRVFASLNSPGTLAVLLGLSLLCYLTISRARPVTVLGATLVAVALSLTFVRSAWVGLVVAALAHVVASRGASARLVLGSLAVAVAATIALSPISSTAQNVINRVESIGQSRETSTTERKATFVETAPDAARQPLGHGLGSAGEASKLTGDSTLRAPDNGYLALIYQAGPVGFLMVMGAIALILHAAWVGARQRAPGQELRLLLFAMLVYLLVVHAAGDEFYGSHGVIFWFICGQVLAYDVRRRAAARLDFLRGSASASA